MTLADMIATDENALICDLAETYHIYDYKSLPALKVATFSVGLRDNSRIKLKMNHIRHPLDTLLLASIADRLSLIVWMKTKDGERGVNRPQSFMAKLLGESEKKDVIAFDSPADFDEQWKKLTKGGNGQWQEQN